MDQQSLCEVEDGEDREMRSMVPFGARQAVAAVPLTVDLAAIVYDPQQQISITTDGGGWVPALKHSTGATRTSTVTQDNAKGADSDEDRTED